MWYFVYIATVYYTFTSVSVWAVYQIHYNVALRSIVTWAGFFRKGLNFMTFIVVVFILCSLLLMKMEKMANGPKNMVSVSQSYK